MLKEVRQKALNKGLCLAIVQVGKNAASVSYLKEKQLACEKTGIRFRLTQFSQNTSQEKLKQEIKKLSQSPLVHGIVVQLPLPPSIIRLIIKDLVKPRTYSFGYCKVFNNIGS